MATLNFDILSSAIRSLSLHKYEGRVAHVKGSKIESIGPMVEIGTPVTIHSSTTEARAQVVGFENGRYILMPYEDNLRITVGASVVASSRSDKVGVSEKNLGRIVNCFNEPIDENGALSTDALVDLFRQPPNPLKRKPITKIFETKVKVLDLFLTAGQGQRLGIMASAGVGKSTLMGMIARNSSADVNVICLIGERGREVNEFIQRDLGDGMKKSILIVSTAEESSLRRIRAAMLALAYAEYFRDSGKNVLFLCDSLTRLAQSLRELGAALGEPPLSRGYPPSCFQFLAKYLERFGNSDSEGSLTSYFTVLVEGDDHDEPVSDSVKAILDGHIVLSRDLALKGVYPAVDCLRSISRLADQIQPPVAQKLVQAMRTLIQVYEENKDLFLVGAYKPGADLTLDTAIQKHDEIMEFIKQTPNEAYDFETTLNRAKSIFNLNAK